MLASTVARSIVAAFFLAISDTAVTYLRNRLGLGF